MDEGVTDPVVPEPTDQSTPLSVRDRHTGLDVPSRVPKELMVMKSRFTLFALIVLLAALPGRAGAATSSQPLFFAAATGDKMSLFGDRLDDADMYGLGVEGSNLFFKSNGGYRWYSQHNADGGPSALLVLTSSGRLGIGTATPDHELIVQGDDPALQIRDDTTDNSANAARLELLERAGGSFNGGAYIWWNGQTNKLLIGTKESNINTNILVIDRAGLNVGIGTSTPNAQYRLSVNGKIRAKEVVVETGWSDFVFEPAYRLAPLHEVEAYIKQHGRLPGMPSAAEVEEHGVSLGEVEARLLQKVEELTLYTIEAHRRLEAVERENASLRAALAAAGER